MFGAVGPCGGVRARTNWVCFAYLSLVHRPPGTAPRRPELALFRPVDPSRPHGPPDVPLCPSLALFRIIGWGRSKAAGQSRIHNPQPESRNREIGFVSAADFFLSRCRPTLFTFQCATSGYSLFIYYTTSGVYCRMKSGLVPQIGQVRAQPCHSRAGMSPLERQGAGERRNRKGSCRMAFSPCGLKKPRAKPPRPPRRAKPGTEKTAASHLKPDSQPPMNGDGLGYGWRRGRHRPQPGLRPEPRAPRAGHAKSAKKSKTRIALPLAIFASLRET